jgi:hypothetical protein
MSSTKAAYEIYRFGEGYDEDKKIKTCIDEVYTNFVKRIFIPPDIWLSIWNTYIKDPLKPEIHQKSLPCPPIIEISKETFQEMLKKTTFPEKRIPEEMSGRKILKEMTLQLSHEILQKTLGITAIKPSQNWQKMLFELSLGITAIKPSQNWQKMLFELSDGIFKNMEKKYPTELYTKIVKIRNYDLDLLHKAPFIIFDHCFNCDLFENTLSEGETGFVEEKKRIVKENPDPDGRYNESYILDIPSEYKELQSERKMIEYRAYTQLYEKYIEKYMIPYLEVA